MTELSWTCTLKESGVFPYVSNQVALRPFPFPFKAALSIVNDSSGISDEAFHDWHSAPRSRNLEVGDSLCFAPDGTILGGARRIDLARNGFIDGISDFPGDVDSAVSVLENEKITLNWYAGKKAISAAVPMSKCGVRFFSDPAWVDPKKFSDHRDYRMQIKLNDAIDQFKLYYSNFVDTGDRYNPKQIAARLKEDDLSRFLIEWFNKSIVTDKSETNNDFAIFKRYSGWFEPSAHCFPEQLRSLFLDRLGQYGGVLFLAQKFGDWALIGRNAKREERVPARIPVFDNNELLCWDDIADRFHKGQLWVAMPSRVLRWLELREKIKYSCKVVEGKLIITIHGEQTSTGQCIPVPEVDLNGIAFTIPKDSLEVHVVTDWSRAELVVLRDPDPVLSNHECVYSPWSAIIWPVN